MTMCIKDMNSTGGGSGSESGIRRRGKCKWFNVAKGWGFITPVDGGPDVFVHQSVIQMAGFRSLGDDEIVEFECKASDKGVEATSVMGPEGEDCKGSHRRPLAKKKFRKIRCYNCGEFANHIAAKCSLGPQPKRCHFCKSEDHLIAECTQREEKKKKLSVVLATTTTGAKISSLQDGHNHLDNGDSRYGDEEIHDCNGHGCPDSSLSPSSSCTNSSSDKREL